MISQGMIIFDTIIAAGGALLALGFLGVDIHKKKRKELKCMKGKTTARVLTAETTKELDPNWKRYDTPSQKMDEKRYSGYIFSLNGKDYTGYGEVSAVSFKDKIKVRYNPDDPNENCTDYDYTTCTGIAEARACLIISAAVILAPIILGLIFG